MVSVSDNWSFMKRSSHCISVISYVSQHIAWNSHHWHNIAHLRARSRLLLWIMIWSIWKPRSDDRRFPACISSDHESGCCSWYSSPSSCPLIKPSPTFYSVSIHQIDMILNMPDKLIVYLSTRDHHAMHWGHCSSSHLTLVKCLLTETRTACSLYPQVTESMHDQPEASKTFNTWRSDSVSYMTSSPCCNRCFLSFSRRRNTPRVSDRVNIVSYMTNNLQPLHQHVVTRGRNLDVNDWLFLLTTVRFAGVNRQNHSSKFIFTGPDTQRTQLLYHSKRKALTWRYHSLYSVIWEVTCDFELKSRSRTDKSFWCVVCCGSTTQIMTTKPHWLIDHSIISSLDSLRPLRGKCQVLTEVQICTSNDNTN
jgi:hypothetical protein